MNRLRMMVLLMMLQAVVLVTFGGDDGSAEDDGHGDDEGADAVVSFPWQSAQTQPLHSEAQKPRPSKGTVECMPPALLSFTP